MRPVVFTKVKLRIADSVVASSLVPTDPGHTTVSTVDSLLVLLWVAR